MTLDGQFSVLRALPWDKALDTLGALIQGRDGNLYGVSSSSGDDAAGSVWRVSLAGKFKELAAMTQAQGWRPQGSLLEGDDGNFYGLATEGGLHDAGTVFMVTPQGVLTDIYDFDGYTAANPVGGLAYSATRDQMIGVTNGATPVLFGFSNGDIQVIHSFQAQFPTAVTVGPNGQYFGFVAGVPPESVFAVDQNRESIRTAGPVPSGVGLLASPTFTADGKAIIGCTTTGGASGYGQVFQVARP
jgi:uncharacterized repeat protein (TIGR03803 family)